eukprot:1789001-Rhodomonas_salina.1
MTSAFRKDEWGNSDCIRHLSRLMGRGFLVFTQRSNLTYTCWGTDDPAEQHILYNSTCPVSGKLVHFDPVWSSSLPTTTLSELIEELRRRRRTAIADDNRSLVIDVDSEPEDETAASACSTTTSARLREPVSMAYVRSAEEVRELDTGGSSSRNQIVPEQGPVDWNHQPRGGDDSMLRPIPDSPQPTCSRTVIPVRTQLNVFATPFTLQVPRQNAGILETPSRPLICQPPIPADTRSSRQNQQTTKGGAATLRKPAPPKPKETSFDPT